MDLQNDATNTLDAIERARAEGYDIWEMAVSAGIEASDRGNEARWFIGDLALLVDKRYGEDAIAQFAKEIKCAVKSVKTYRTTCRFWDREKSRRQDFLLDLKNVFFTHYADAVRLKDMDKAVEFIENCHLNDWSVEKARVELQILLGKPTPPEKLLDTEAVIAMSHNRVSFSIGPNDIRKVFEAAQKKRPVRIVVYGAADEPEQTADTGTGEGIAPDAHGTEDEDTSRLRLTRLSA